MSKRFLIAVSGLCVFAVSVVAGEKFVAIDSGHPAVLDQAPEKSTWVENVDDSHELVLKSVPEMQHNVEVDWQEHSNEEALESRVCTECDSALDSMQAGVVVADRLAAQYTDIERWALASPQNALDWIIEIASAEQQRAFELLIVHTLLPSHPHVVYDYRELLTQQVSRDVVDRSYLRALAESDAVYAFDLAEAFIDSDNRLTAMSIVAVQWAVSGYPGLLDRIAMVKDETQQLHLFSSIAALMASSRVATDPTDALNWLETLSEKQRQLAMPEVFSSWLQQDRDAARQWLDQIPLTDVKQVMIDLDFWFSLEHDIDRALRVFTEVTAMHGYPSDYVYSLTSVLTRKNPDQTEAFILTLSEEHRTVARVAVRDQLLNKDPHAYLDLYYSLDDPEKVRHLMGALMNLKYREPQLLSQWLMTSRISGAEVEQAEELLDDYVSVEYFGC